MSDDTTPAYWRKVLDDGSLLLSSPLLLGFAVWVYNYVNEYPVDALEIFNGACVKYTMFVANYKITGDDISERARLLAVAQEHLNPKSQPANKDSTSQ